MDRLFWSAAGNIFATCLFAVRVGGSPSMVITEQGIAFYVVRES